MKEYIKKFNDFSSADGYKIKNIPWIGTAVKTGGGGRLNLRCTTPDKMLVVSGDTIIKVSTLELTGGTWDGSGSDNETRVFISGDVTLTGKTDCYSLAFEEGGHLTINAGARLRIWQGGIVNNDCTTVNYLTIVEDAVNDVYGEFLLHPDVTVNNHPLASVELISRSCYRYPTYENIRQYFGISMKKDGLASITAQDNHETRFFVFDYNANKWKALGYINPSPGYESETLNINDLNSPFEYYQMLDFVATTPTPGTKYTMKGQWYGNESPELVILGNSYNGFSNSFTGSIKTSLLLSLLVEHNITSIQVGPNNTEINSSNVGQWPYIQPGYCQFLVSNTGAQFNLTLNYKDLVWDPSFEEETTLALSLSKGSLMSSPKPTEIDTALEGSAIFDNPEPAFPPEHNER